MCGGMEFVKHQGAATEADWNAVLLGAEAAAERSVHRVYFPNPKAALLVAPDTNLWLPWGRRREQPGDWPEGGWARAENLGKGYWLRWHPERVVVHPVRWMEKDRHRASRWFELAPGQGILCLRLDAAPGTPLYVVTRPAEGDYLADIHDRMPELVD